jgi:hypothetical protein
MLVKLPNIKTHENLFGCSQIAICGQTDMERLTGGFLAFSLLQACLKQFEKKINKQQ